jgi:ABC-type glutathione transport system ATPase component
MGSRHGAITMACKIKLVATTCPVERALRADPKALPLDDSLSAHGPITLPKIELLPLRLKDSCILIIMTHNKQWATHAGRYTTFMLDGKPIEYNDTSKLFTTPADPALRLTSPDVLDEDLPHRIYRRGFVRLCVE